MSLPCPPPPRDPPPTRGEPCVPEVVTVGGSRPRRPRRPRALWRENHFFFFYFMFKMWISHFNRFFSEFTELLAARAEAANTRDSPRAFPPQRSPGRGGGSPRPPPFNPTTAGGSMGLRAQKPTTENTASLEKGFISP